ncbi:hypothetical protein D3C79_818580 [compost metagenome]
MQLTAGNGGIDLRVFAQLGADRPGPQSRAPRSFALAQVQLLGTRFCHRAGLIECSLKALTIYAHQQVASLDPLVVLHLELTHPAGHVGRDDHHVGPHPCITRPWGEHVVLPELIAGQNGDGDHAESHQGTDDSTHRITPYKGPSRRTTRYSTQTNSAVSNSASCQIQRPNGVACTTKRNKPVSTRAINT